MGDVFEIFPAYEENAIRVDIFNDTLESIVAFNPLTGEEGKEIEEIFLYPARHFVSDKGKNKKVTKEIK